MVAQSEAVMATGVALVMGAGIAAMAAVNGGGRAASRPCEGSQPSVRGAGLLVGRVLKGFSLPAVTKYGRLAAEIETCAAKP